MSCAADTANERVWLSILLMETVHGFTTVVGVSRMDRYVGLLLAFDFVELKVQRKFMNGSFNITRCGDYYIIGLAETNRFSIWSWKEAVEDCPGLLKWLLRWQLGESKSRKPKQSMKKWSLTSFITSNPINQKWWICCFRWHAICVWCKDDCRACLRAWDSFIFVAFFWSECIGSLLWQSRQYLDQGAVLYRITQHDPFGGWWLWFCLGHLHDASEHSFAFWREIYLHFECSWV